MPPLFPTTGMSVINRMPGMPKSPMIRRQNPRKFARMRQTGGLRQMMRQNLRMQARRGGFRGL